jgi:hypothetical protein
LTAWRDVLVVWAVSRAAFLVVGALGHAFLSTGDFVGAYHAPAGTLSYWANWDGAWYSHIATHGYDNATTTAFFPLFPIVVRGVMELGAGPALAGVLVSSAAALAACFFVYRLAERWSDVRAARAAALALALFPTSFFLNAAYSESLFLALTGGCLWALYVRRDVFTAGAFGYFAAVTRNVGVLLVIPLAYEWFRNRREHGPDAIVGLLGPPVGLATYCFYLWKASHKPLLFAVAQKAAWDRTATSPLTTVAHGWHQSSNGFAYVFRPDRVFGTTSVNPPFLLSETVSFACLVVVVVLVVGAFRYLPWPVAVYCVPVAIAPLLLPGPQIALIGYPRYALAPVPLFVVLGRLLSKRRSVLALWLLATAALAVYLTLEFVTWRWVA